MTSSVNSVVRDVIEAAIPVIEMAAFRPPMRFDGCDVPHYGFFNTENGTCLQSFTAQQGYEMTTRDDYIALAEAGIAAMGGNAVCTANWTQSKSSAKATIVIQPSREYRLRMYDIGGGDTIWQRLIISAPFGRRFNVDGGFYRDACRNLARVRQVRSVVSVSLSHTSQLRGRLDQLVETMRRCDSFETIAARMREYNQIEVDTAKFLGQLYPLAADAGQSTRTRAENRASKIYGRIMRERLELSINRQSDRATLWELVSAVTGYIQHDKSRRVGNGSELSTFGRAVTALDDSETNDCWQLVEQLAIAS